MARLLISKDHMNDVIALIASKGLTEDDLCLIADSVSVDHEDEPRFDWVKALTVI